MALVLCFSSGANSSPLFAVPAYAEEGAPELHITASAAPEEFIVPGDAVLTFELVNASGNAMEAVSLTAGSLLEPIGDIAAGASQTYTRTHALTVTELASGRIDYTVTCMVDGEQYSYPVSIPIRRGVADPRVEFLRQVSNRSVSDGGSVTLMYTLRNVGNVPVTAISIADPLGGFDGRLDSLAVGASKVFLHHVSLSEDAVSAPILTYAADGGNVYTSTLDELPIQLAHGMLDATLAAGRSMFSADTAEVSLQLVNRGNLDYLDVAVYDDVYGGVIADSIRMPAGGEPVEVLRSYPLRQDSDYRWRVTGRTSAGDVIDFVTNTASVQLESVPGDPLLTVRASAGMTRISRRGYVPIRLELTNVGAALATHVRISEAASGEICELAVIPTGDPTVYEFDHLVSQDTTLIFTASYADRQGLERIASAAPIEITIGAGGEMPHGAGNSSMLFGGIATQMQNTPLFVALLAGCCLVLVALVVALVITSRRARAQRKSRAAAIRQRKKEDMARTAPFKPIRKKIKGKK